MEFTWVIVLEHRAGWRRMDVDLEGQKENVQHSCLGLQSSFFPELGR